MARNSVLYILMGSFSVKYLVIVSIFFFQIFVKVRNILVGGNEFYEKKKPNISIACFNS